MSLKEQSKEIYQRYGLTDEEINIYMVFLSYPQFTVSEVAGVLGKEEQLDEIQQLADKLENQKLIKKIPGVIERYVPMEPYLGVFTKESTKFRENIEITKDEALSDQSTRFENLEAIEKIAKEGIQSSVKAQMDGVNSESEAKDTYKKETIENAIARFKQTSENLMQTIQDATFQARDSFEGERTAYTTHVKTKTEQARDRFQETTQSLQNTLQETIFTGRDQFQETGRAVEAHLQEILEKGRDRYDSTSKALEKDLHTHLDTRKGQLHATVEERDAETKELWSYHAAKFKEKNDSLNSELTTYVSDHNSKTRGFEQATHSTINSLNKSLKTISELFKDTYKNGIQEQKQQMNKIMDDLLKDFSDRVQNLDRELKKSLDNYVTFHKENADELKPTLDEILEKNILRMNQVIDDLKEQFSQLLQDHIATFNKSNLDLKDSIIERVGSRHSQLSERASDFKNSSLELMENLQDTSDRYADLAKALAKRGSAWKALLLGKHKVWKANHQEIQDRITKISDNMKQAFEDSTASFIQDTDATTTELNTEIANITQAKNDEFMNQTDSLNEKQRTTLEAQLEGIAVDLTNETDGTLQTNVKGVEDTNLKLKDSVGTTISTHHEDFDLYLNKHRQTCLDFDDQRNDNTKLTVNKWYEDMDQAHNLKISEVSEEIEDHLSKVNAHLSKSTGLVDQHSALSFEDTANTKDKQRKVFDKLLLDADADFSECKQKISTDIDGQIHLIKEEVAQMDEHQKATLEEQIALIKKEFEEKNQKQWDDLTKEMDLFKQEVAEINQEQQTQVDTHIEKFKSIIAELDTKQHGDITNQIELFTKESNEMEITFHDMFAKHKADYDKNTAALQESLFNTLETNIQDTKDAIADFTLTFMNTIDDTSETVKTNEDALADISQAAMDIKPLGNSSTWHTFGTNALLQSMVSALRRAKSTITIISPSVEPKILEALSQVAYTKKSVRFLYTTSWDLGTYGRIVEKMKQLGNIQFRNLKSNNDFYAVSRDGEEIILCPKAKHEKDMISIVSMQEGYAQIFSSFIYPMFQANSRPI